MEKLVTIELSNGYFIEIDPMNYTLKRNKTITNKKSGEKKQRTVTIGYYGELEHCVKEFLRQNGHDLMSNECISMDEYIDRLEASVNNAVIDICKALKVQGELRNTK
jgi:DNA replication protein DnaD